MSCLCGTDSVNSSGAEVRPPLSPPRPVKMAGSYAECPSFHVMGSWR
jgi:hypothetical protein